MLERLYQCYCNQPLMEASEAEFDKFKDNQISCLQISSSPVTSASRPRVMSGTGYYSDISDGMPSLTQALVHQRSLQSFYESYDATQSRVLGSGTFGTVSTVRHRESGDTLAMKVIQAQSHVSMSAYRNELELHRRLDHPNICKVLESFEDTESKRFIIIMELLTGGTLISCLKERHRNGYNEAAAATITEKMLSAILYCHQHGVVHRDIKLDNMLFESEREDSDIKLIDFGFASSVQPGNEMMHGRLGTPSYMAPELWSEQRDFAYDSSVDMWALGAAVYMLLSGMRPFHSTDKERKGQMIRHSPLCFPLASWEQVSVAATDFCSALMQKRPRDRLSASEAIKHAWITGQSRAHSEPEDAVRALLDNAAVVTALEEYANAEELKQLALEVIAFSTPPKNFDHLRHIFQVIDTDGSGTIDISEFEVAMRGGSKLPSQRLKRIFNEIDANRSGEIDYTEFLAAALSSRGVERRSLRAAFNKLDDDADGFISRADLVGALDGRLSPSALDAVLKGADSNGRVSYGAFKRCVAGDFSDVRGG